MCSLAGTSLRHLIRNLAIVHFERSFPAVRGIEVTLEAVAWPCQNQSRASKPRSTCSSSSRLFHSTARHPCCALDVIDSHRDSSIRLLGFRARRATSRFVRLMCSTSDSSTRPRRPCSMRRDSIRPCSTRRDSSLVYTMFCDAAVSAPALLRAS